MLRRADGELNVWERENDILNKRVLVYICVYTLSHQLVRVVYRLNDMSPGDDLYSYTFRSRVELITVECVCVCPVCPKVSNIIKIKITRKIMFSRAHICVFSN